jgi:LuxR family transcriptional regulator, quorum-sensing system regulator SdiA
MLQPSIPDYVDNYDEITESIGRIALTGYVMIFNYTFTGPEHLDYRMPASWRKIYEQESYMMFDPVVHWGFLKAGDKRWTDIRMPDIRKILKKAADHGLRHDASFSRHIDGRRSMLSVSRPDREITDAEMGTLSGIFDDLVSIIDGECGLTDKEKDVLALLKIGYDYKAMASELNLAEATVKSRSKSARTKLNCLTVTAAVAKAVERGYV